MASVRAFAEHWRWPARPAGQQCRRDGAADAGEHRATASSCSSARTIWATSCSPGCCCPRCCAATRRGWSRCRLDRAPRRRRRLSSTATAAAPYTAAAGLLELEVGQPAVRHRAAARAARARLCPSPRRPRIPGLASTGLVGDPEGWARTASCAPSGPCSSRRSPSRRRPAPASTLYAATVAEPGPTSGRSTSAKAAGRSGRRACRRWPRTRRWPGGCGRSAKSSPACVTRGRRIDGLSVDCATCSRTWCWSSTTARSTRS